MNKVDTVTKLDIIMLLCDTFHDKKPDYASIHKIVEAAQKKLESKHGVTMGYSFKDPSIYSTWSNELQDDLERYEAIDGYIRTNDVGVICLSGRDRGAGDFILATVGKRNLERKFGDFEKLTQEMQTCA